MKSGVKVCHITTVHPAGDTRIFVKECSSLAAAGFDVHLVSGNEVKNTNPGDVSVHYVNINSDNRFLRMLSGGYKVYKAALKLNASIYHFHDPELIPYALLLRLHGKKVIYDVHEDLPMQILGKKYISPFARRIVSFFARSTEWFSSRFFNAIITATPHIRNRFLKYNSNTIDLLNYPDLNELPAPIPGKQYGRDICYIGSITEVRGLREMIRAVDGVDCTLHLCGPIWPDSLKAEVQQMPGWKKVIYYDYSSRETIKEVLNKCSVGLVVLHPTNAYMNAYPVKLFEYQSAGLAVIGSHFPLWLSFITDHNCGIPVDPLNPDEIRNAIHTLINDPELCRQMGTNGRQAAERYYNWSTEKEKLISLYHSLT